MENWQKKRGHFKEQEIVEGGQGSQYSLSYQCNELSQKGS